VKLVVDTNVLISRLLLPDSIPGQAVVFALRQAQILASGATVEELAKVLQRPKFDRYVTAEERRRFLNEIARVVVWVQIEHRIRACRDPRDDKFLELAVNGEADAILSGDADLLALDPFQGIAIITPSVWMSQQHDEAL
jgi:uncharacterized protein